MEDWNHCSTSKTVDQVFTIIQLSDILSYTMLPIDDSVTR